MGLKLNEIDDEVNQENLELMLERLKERLAVAPPAAGSPDLEKHYHFVGANSLQVGLRMYQQESEPDLIKTHLARAGQFLLREHAIRRKPEPGQYRSPWRFETALNLIVCFCGPDETKSASAIHQWQYRNPAYPEQDAFASYLEVLKTYVAGKPPDSQAIQQIEAHCLSDTASKEDRVFLLPKAQGLSALSRSDSAGWERAIEDLVKAHEIEARLGEYRLEVEGFMSLPALMLAKLGQRLGMKCILSSPYLPLSLLEFKK